MQLHEENITAPYLADARQVAEAVDLIESFGEGAEMEAAIRAGHMRHIGNYLHFCRWRQTERLIALMSLTQPIGTIQ